MRGFLKSDLKQDENFIRNPPLSTINFDEIKKSIRMHQRLKSE